MKNSRKHPRWETSEYVQHRSCIKNVFIEVKDRNSGKCVGNLLDLSREGMKLVCTTEIRKGTRHSFTFKLPISKGVSRSVFVDARCVWSTHDEDETTCQAGFEFTLVLEESKRHIDELLQRKGRLSFQIAR